MALDVYVMPLWRFKAGDFTSPLEETLGIKPTVISLAAPSLPRAPWYLRLLAKIGILQYVPRPREASPEERRAAAVREVDALKAQLSELIGAPVEWSDTGGIYYNRQFHGPAVIRAFAAWHDHREELPEFTSPPEGNYGKHPVWSLPKPAERRFPMLVEHNLHTGYFVPVPFDGLYRVEPFKVLDHWELFHDVASTQTILRELAGFLELIANVPEVREPEHGSIPVSDARWCAQELQRICTLSIEHGLPVIFYG